jgi:4-diphosphocytidyl-2-C-methyl-D-erythritol kinase
MQLRAFAKINLDLRVLGRRDDGYHEVRTILQTIDWSDEISIDPADRFEFIARGVSSGEDNLVVKAVRAFEKLTGESVRARIELIKHVPMGAGLGGGSADAAVTLLGLQKFCQREIPEPELFEALGRLGSDVPFFAIGGRALGVGRGNEITALDDHDGEARYGLVIVHPGISISTPEAYSWLTVPDKPSSIRGFGAESVSGSGEDEPRNDFESVVFARHPLLSDIKSEILKAGAVRAALSGSGSAIFGIFGSVEQAAEALPRFSHFGTVKATRPLSRPEYLRSLWGVAKW